MCADENIIDKRTIWVTNLEFIFFDVGVLCEKRTFGVWFKKKSFHQFLESYYKLEIYSSSEWLSMINQKFDFSHII